MIIEFSVQNFRSIKDLQTLSFVATKSDSNQEKYPLVDKNNIAEDSETKLLKTVGIYGANASGKSNIIRALAYFVQAIRNEASSESNLSSLCDPFLYQENEIESESLFQINLILDNKKYRYGFTVKRNNNYKDLIDNDNSKKASKEIITGEWLYGTKEKNKGEYFIRNGMDVKKDKLPEKDKIPALPFEHTLFITHAAAFDADGICATIRKFFTNWTISNLTHGLEPYRFNSIYVLEKENKKQVFLDLLSSFNLKYNDVILERDPNAPEQKIFPQNKIFLAKHYVNSKSESKDIRLNLSNNESAGTQKLFDLAGLLIRAFNLSVTAFIILDEIDSNFHPSLLIKLIGLFNNPQINKSNSQLLFTSHDTNLMDPSIMRRDQFYFTEKDENDATRLYSLADLKGIRNDADFAKQYLAGFYGAIPILDRYSNYSTEENEGTMEH